MLDSRIPEPLKDVVTQFAQLPGFGAKSAMRVALKLLEWPKEKTVDFGQAIIDLREKLCLCSRCYGLTQENPCRLCADPARSKTSLCLVPEWDSMLILEKGGFYHGQYFVLGGLFVPLDKDGQKLRIEPLLARLGEGEITEVIFALGATSDAEQTTSFVSECIKAQFPTMLLSRLAQGLPLGAEVKYMDTETLRQSLRYRQKL